ncbi:hypothetical protein PMW_62 [Pseudomonas phage phiPMW]|uniref:Uncharacterized protein n=1 Tax=Pseudomonas phage phiPMW TaxID=1815582 RepID=A0A1S5R1C9_9CAUD|nr:hypothetical protein FDG97_gp062 [Pseudomonas phage phiPMW]ANA49187.1 hypothetical protein PMW_62 [Pseudomonas phage phiPMW]
MGGNQRYSGLPNNHTDTSNTRSYSLLRPLTLIGETAQHLTECAHLNRWAFLCL